MEDFLKDRPIMESAAATGDDSALGEEAKETAQPFGALGSAGVKDSSENNDAASDTLGIAGDSEETGASVRTIVERGRVTRIIVTCSCGKVSEIDCKY